MTARSTSSRPPGTTADCPADEVLALYLEEGLPAAARAAVDAHMVACRMCAGLLGSSTSDRSLAHLARRLSAATPATPQMLGRYRVIAPLGAGAMGTVVRATDPELGRDVAIKRVGACCAADLDRYQRRLRAEAQMLAAVADPRIVSVYDVGEHDGVLFIVMALVQGQTLRRWSVHASPRAVLRTMTAAARVLARLHAHGLVHGDFKPDNVMVLPSGDVRILDFGLARLLAEQRTTAVGDARRMGPGPGTPAYLAPESLAGASPSPAADQYAWSTALFEALVGKRPRPAKSLDALREQALSGTVVWPPGNAVPKRVRGVVERALQPNPSARWPTLDLAAQMLERKPRVWASGLGLAGLAGLAGVATVLAAPPRAECLANQPFATWTEAATVRLEQRFLALGYSGAHATEIGKRLAAYGTRWGEQVQLACLASDGPRTPSHACLLAARRDFTSTAAVLEGGDPESIRRGNELVDRLPLPDQCLRQPQDVGERGALADALQDSLARARVLRLAGRSEAARAMSEAVYDAAAAGLPRLRARAALEAAGSDVRGAATTPEQWFQRAYEQGLANGDDHVAAAAALSSVWLSIRKGDLDDADRWVGQARALLQRSGSRRQRAVLHSRLSFLHRARGNGQQALAEAETALAVYTDLDGPGALETIKARVSVGHSLLRLGRYEEASTMFGQAVDDVVAQHGEIHAVAANALNGRGHAVANLGDLESSLRYYERGRAIQRALYGDASALVAGIESNMGATLTELQRYDEAIVVLAHSLAVITEAHGPEDLQSVDPLVNLARAYCRAGRVDDGLQTAWRAATLYQARGEPGAPTQGVIESGLGLAYETGGNWSDATEHYRRALEIFRARLGPTHPSVAETTDDLQRVQQHAELGD